MKTLRELFDEACEQVKAGDALNPDFLKAFDLVLIAGGLKPTDGLQVDYLVDIGNRIYIELAPSLSTNGFNKLYQKEDMNFPSHIIDSEDPVKAATIWRLETQAREFKALINISQQKVEKYEAAYQATVKQLQTLKGIRVFKEET